MAKKSKLTQLFSRMDFQVLAIVLGYTIIGSLITMHLVWDMSMDTMVDGYIKRAIALHDSVEEFIVPEAYTEINVRDDFYGELYEKEKYALTNMKVATEVMYLYTAKMTDTGEYVYVIDGYEDSEDEYFKYPNDLLEDFRIPYMEEALKGELATSESIIDTEWGFRFVSFFPYRNENGEILGVVGIEFDGADNITSYRNLQWQTSRLCMILVVTATALSISMFRRITNPLYIGKNTQDILTGMKNRNSYEVDLNNYSARGNLEGMGVILADVNGLKEVNDRLGHDMGDKYICLVSKAIHDSKTNNMIGYRTGGDEFVIFCHCETEQGLEVFVNSCREKVQANKFEDMRCSVACGYVLFDPQRDKNLHETVKRADKMMYKDKESQKYARVR